MAHIKLVLLMSACVAESFSYHHIQKKNSAFSYANQSPSESYIGPSSYTTSFGNDLPGFGNFGSLMNMRNPAVSSSYSSFGPSTDTSGFGSTSYVNYPPTSIKETSQHQMNSIFTPNRMHPAITSYLNSLNTGSFSQDSYKAPFTPQHHKEETPISQHVEVTKPVVVPVYKKFPYPVSKRFPVAIPHPVLVPVPAPYPVNVDISQPVAVPVIREIRIPIEREVMYAVEKYVPVTVEKPVQYHVEKHYPVYIPKPYPVKVPIIKTVIHKAPKKW